MPPGLGFERLGSVARPGGEGVPHEGDEPERAPQAHGHHGPALVPHLRDLDSLRPASPAQLRRPGRPEEIAALIAFLASDDADYMTGQTVAMSGGMSFN